MTMGNRKLLIVLAGLMFLVVACSVGRIAEQISGGPQSVAREAFEKWAKEAGIPYQDVRYATLSDDGTFATVRVTGFFAERAEAGWREMQADVACRKVAGEWRCDQQFYFTLSEAEQQRIIAGQNATTTAVSQSQQATATAISMAEATKVAEAALAANATATAIIEQQLEDLYTQAMVARESGDWWLEAYRLAAIANIRTGYRDVDIRLGDLNPRIGHIIFYRGQEMYMVDGLGNNEEYIGSGDFAELSPDGAKIAIVRGLDLHVGPLRGDHPILFSGSRDFEQDRICDVSWAPDSRRLAFSICYTGANYYGEHPEAVGFFMLDTQTKEVKQITPGPGDRPMYGGTICWAPTDYQLAYAPSYGDGLHTINNDGTADTLIYPEWYAGINDCEWAPPDSQYILFVDQGQLRRISPDGSDLSSLQFESEFVWAKCVDFSPDGSKIVYVSSGNLVIANPDGSNPQTIITEIEDVGEISWER